MSDRRQLTYPASLQGASQRLAAGEQPGDLGLAGWQITDRSLILGNGTDCFAAASRRLLGWQAHGHARVRADRVGDVVTLRIGPTTSPCLILREEQSPSRTTLVYGTLPGHVECGEEAFLIDMARDGTVAGRCVAFSRPAWFWARVGTPVARVVQLLITDTYLRGMRP